MHPLCAFALPPSGADGRCKIERDVLEDPSGELYKTCRQVYHQMFYWAYLSNNQVRFIKEYRDICYTLSKLYKSSAGSNFNISDLKRSQKWIYFLISNWINKNLFYSGGERKLHLPNVQMLLKKCHRETISWVRMCALLFSAFEWR